MSRDSEKVLKELQKFLDAHAEDTENEADVDALAERFFAEYNLKCKEQKESAPERRTIIWISPNRSRRRKKEWNICTRRWSWSRTIWMQDSN